MIYTECNDECGKRIDINSIKQSANLYNYALNSPIMYFDGSGDYVTGYGISGSVAAVFGYKGQVLWVTDNQGNFAIMTVNGIVGSIGVSLGGIAFTFPDMPTIYDMAGQGFSLTGSIGNNGGGVIVSGNYVGYAYTYGIGLEIDVWIGADGTYTYITPIHGNIYAN